MIGVKQARYVGDYRTWLEFSSGESGVVDLAGLIDATPAAAAIKDPAEFSRFYLDQWPTLAWPCGFDIAVDVLSTQPSYKQKAGIGRQP